jgi:hypothetical protein
MICGGGGVECWQMMVVQEYFSMACLVPIPVWPHQPPVGRHQWLDQALAAWHEYDQDLSRNNRQ